MIISLIESPRLTSWGSRVRKCFSLSILVFFAAMQASCASTQRSSISEYNCKAIEGWVLKAQADSASAHTIHLIPATYDENLISLFADLSYPNEYDKYFEDSVHAIIQPTHYYLFPELVPLLAGCFDAHAVDTAFGTKAVADISRSTLVIEATNRCGRDYKNECTIMSLTFVPPPGQRF